MGNKKTEKAKQSDALSQLLCHFNLTPAELEQQTGVSKFVISRTKSGKTLMSKPNRQRIARFLGRKCASASELQSLLRKIDWPLTDEELRIAESNLRAPESVRLHGIPHFDVQRHVCRVCQADRLQKALLDIKEPSKSVFVLHGMAGVGKTELALYLVHNPEIRNHFLGGIFWVNMEGQEESYLWIKLADFLGIKLPVDDLNIEARSLKQLQSRVQRSLPSGRLLVVLDGMEVNIEPWLGSTHRCFLITTQLAQWGDYRSQGQIDAHELDIMSDEESRNLLTLEVPVNVAESDLQRLLALLERHPLALSITNQLARNDRGFHNLVAEMAEPVLPKLDLDRGTTNQGSANKHRNVQWAFTVGYNRLTEDTKKVFRFLGVTPQPFRIRPIEAISGLSEVGAGLRAISGQGLAKIERPGIYRTHRLLHEYAGVLVKQADERELPNWNQKFAEYYLNHSHDIWQLWSSGHEQEALLQWAEHEPYYIAGYFYAAQLGIQDWLVGYWRNLHIYLSINQRKALIAEWQKILTDVVVEPDPLAIAAFYIGQAYLAAGDAQSAIPFLENARNWCWDKNEQEDWLLATIVLCKAWLAAGSRETALALLQEHDDAYERIANTLRSDNPVTLDAWEFFGMIRQMQGNYWAAVYGYRKAQELFHMQPEASCKRMVEAGVCIGLGLSYIAIGKRSEALEAFTAGMQAAEAGGYPFQWSENALHRVELLILEGQLESAEELLQEVGKRQTDNDAVSWYLASISGELAWAKGDIEDAEKAYAEAIEQTKRTLWEADLWFRLAYHRERVGNDEGKVAAWQKTRESAKRTQHHHKYLLASLEYGRYLVGKGQKEQGREVLIEIINLAAEERQYGLLSEIATLLDVDPDIVKVLQQRETMQNARFVLPLTMEELGIQSSGIFWVETVGEEQQSTHIPGFGVNTDEFVGKTPLEILLGFGNLPRSEPFDSEEEQQGSFEEPLSEDPIGEH
ncbi:MAG: hypothetical protein JW892_08035 [Anaerolineae bacterium]|nr:hypothetical protein [Anaerolineae bacterium]